MSTDANDIIARRTARVAEVLCRTVEMEALLRAAAKGENIPNIEKRVCPCGEFHGDFTFKDPTPLDDQAIATVALVQQLVALEERHPDVFQEMMKIIIGLITEFVHVIPAAYRMHAPAIPIDKMPGRADPTGGMFS